MSKKLEQTTLIQWTLFAEASPVKICPLPDAGRDWLESEAGYGLSSIEFLQKCARNGWLSKMSPAFYPATEGETLPLSFAGWSNSGMASPGGYLTLSTSEWPSAAAVCSLSDILEMDVPQKYYLSARAARGILRRAEKRGKELPPMLLEALRHLAEEQSVLEKVEGKTR